jgi:hypothetical protein
MNIIIIYNIKDITTSENKLIIENLKKINYNDFWTDENSNTIYLPPNTFWKIDVDIKIPIQELRNILNTLEIDVSRLLNCIVVPAGPWNAIKGTPSNL